MYEIRKWKIERHLLWTLSVAIARSILLEEIRASSSICGGKGIVNVSGQSHCMRAERGNSQSKMEMESGETGARGNWRTKESWRVTGRWGLVEEGVGCSWETKAGGWWMMTKKVGRLISPFLCLPPSIIYLPLFPNSTSPQPLPALTYTSPLPYPLTTSSPCLTPFPSHLFTPTIPSLHWQSSCMVSTWNIDLQQVVCCSRFPHLQYLVFAFYQTNAIAEIFTGIVYLNIET